MVMPLNSNKTRGICERNELKRYNVKAVLIGNNKPAYGAQPTEMCHLWNPVV